MEKCPVCSHPLETTQTFCGNCGYRTNTEGGTATPYKKPLNYELPKSIYFDKKEFRYFMYSALVLAFAPLVTIIVAMFSPVDLVAYVSITVDSVAILSFSFGLFSFSKISSDKVRKDVLISSVLFGIYSISYLLLNFYINTLPIITSENPTTLELENFTNDYFIPSILAFVISILLFEGVISFSRMFKELITEANIVYTNYLKWFGVVLTAGNGLAFIAMFILYIDTGYSALSYNIFSLSSLLTYTVVIFQFLAGYNIFKILRSIELGRIRRDNYLFENR